MTLGELEDTLPWGLHDAYLVRLEVDWARKALTLDVRVQIGEHQETDQLARITVSGLQYFVARPPETNQHPPANELPWIDATAAKPGDEYAKGLPPIPDGCFLHHLYTREPLQFFHVCGRDASLTWLDPEPVPSQSGKHAFFPGEEIPDP